MKWRLSFCFSPPAEETGLSLSSSFSSFHFWIRGGISFWMYSCSHTHTHTHKTQDKTTDLYAYKHALIIFSLLKQVDKGRDEQRQIKPKTCNLLFKKKKKKMTIEDDFHHFGIHWQKRKWYLIFWVALLASVVFRKVKTYTTVQKLN